MPSYSLQEIAEYHGYGYMQTWRHIRELKKKKKFKKTSVGKFFNERDAKLLADLLGFKLPEKKNGKS